MVELLKDERKIYKKGNVWRMYLTQVQEYPEEAVKNFRANFDVDEQEKNEWLAAFEEKKQEAIKAVTDELDAMKAKMVKEIGNINEGQEIWDNPTVLKEDEEWPQL